MGGDVQDTEEEDELTSNTNVKPPEIIERLDAENGGYIPRP